MDRITLHNYLQKRSQNDRDFEETRPIVRGWLMGIDAPNTASVTGRDNYVWVREHGLEGAISQVYNVAVLPTPNLPVLVAYSPKAPFTRQIVGYDTDVLQNIQWQDGGGGNIGATASHAPTHEWRYTGPGDDVVDVYTRALVPFRTVPTTGLFVRVEPSYYLHASTVNFYIGTTALDLSSYNPLPNLGISVFVLIYLDIPTGTVQTISNTVVNEPISGGAPEEVSDNFPTVPANCLPSAIVMLTGQTTISETDVYDVRDVVSAGNYQTSYELTPETIPVRGTGSELLVRGMTPTFTASTDFVHIPANYQHIVFNSYNLSGSMQIDGDLVIL